MTEGEREGSRRPASSDPTMASGWLVCEGRVLSSVDVARSRAERRRGLLGRDRLDGALLIEGCRWVHTLRMRFPLDIAYLDGDGNVIKTVRMARWRVGLPVPRARSVVEGQAGAFERWGLHLGDHLELRDGS